MADPYSIIFLGTPDFAVPALTALNKNNYRIPLVITQPDRPKGRGKKLFPPPVKVCAERFGYNVIQPESIRTREIRDQLVALQPDFLVVVAFGNMLSNDLLAVPAKDSLNIHPSLLPEYRGPAPIQRAIIEGDHKTGVTIMSLDAGMDSGDILMQVDAGIASDDTAATLHDRLADIGANLLIKTLKKYERNEVTRIPQDHSKATFAGMLSKKEGHIDWSLPAERLECFIRGMTPWPGAFTFLEDKRIKVFRAETVPLSESASPGTVIKGFENELRVATGQGALSILEIQGASGKRMDIQSFLRGTSVAPGARFS